MFGDLVLAHRRRLGLTQEELAEKTGVSVRGIGKIEAGRSRAPRPRTARALADAFRLTGDERDRFLAAAGAPAAAESPGRPLGGGGPAQLPMDVPGFAGRREALARLDEILAGAADEPTAVVISAVWGTAGVGKTALAVHWAHRVRRRFPHGQLYVNLRGFGPSGTVMRPTEAIRRFLQALGVTPQRIPAGLDAQAALYRSLLAGRRMLIVLDNARDSDQVRPLLPGAPGSLVVITSRRRLPALLAAEGARPLPLDLLTAEESRDLLARRLGRARINAEPDAVEEVIDRCARLPLALAIVAARVAAHPGLPMAACAASLRDSHARLDALSAGDAITDVRAVLSWSYQALTAAAARLFRQLGLHPGPDVAADAAASLADMPVHRTWPLLTELVDASLVGEPIPGRYTMHDLLRAYATEQALATDPAGDRDAATQRVLDHYLHGTAAATRDLEGPGNRSVLRLTGAPPGAPSFDTIGDARAWLECELANVVAATRLAGELGYHRHACLLPRAAFTFMFHRDRSEVFLELWLGALGAARALADPELEAMAHNYLAGVYAFGGQLAEALDHLDRGVVLARTVGVTELEAAAWGNRAVVEMFLGRYTEAIEHGERAATLAHELGLTAGESRARHCVGTACQALDRLPEALMHLRRSLVLARSAGAHSTFTIALSELGYTHSLLGHSTVAVALLNRALQMKREAGNLDGAAETLSQLGSALRRAGRLEDAIACQRSALDQLRQLATLYDRCQAANELATTLTMLGRHDEAVDVHQEALHLAERIDAGRKRAITLAGDNGAAAGDPRTG